jgi:hypothetical protein
MIRYAIVWVTDDGEWKLETVMSNKDIVVTLDNWCVANDVERSQIYSISTAR